VLNWVKFNKELTINRFINGSVTKWDKMWLVWDKSEP